MQLISGHFLYKPCMSQLQKISPTSVRTHALGLGPILSLIVRSIEGAFWTLSLLDLDRNVNLTLENLPTFNPRTI